MLVKPSNEQRERAMQLALDLREYFEKAEDNNQVNQMNAVAAYDYPEKVKKEVKECGCCVGAHLAYFFAKNPQHGIIVQPFVFDSYHDEDAEYNVYDFMNGLGQRFGPTNEVWDGYMEWACSNYSLEDYVPTLQTELEMRIPGDWDEDEQGKWLESEECREEENMMFDEHIKADQDDVYDETRIRPDGWLNYMEDRGNGILRGTYGETYFFKDGFDALANYIRINTHDGPPPHYDNDEMDNAKRLIYRELTTCGASDRPFSNEDWPEPPSLVVPKAIENLFFHSNGVTGELA